MAEEEKPEQPPEQNQTEQAQPEQEFVPADMDSVLSVLKMLGQILSNMVLYGPQHKVTQQSLVSGFGLLDSVLAKCQGMGISSAEGDLLVDGRPVDLKNPLVAGFARQLAALDIGGFSFSYGATQDEFAKLMALLSTHPDRIKEAGSFADLVAQTGLEHVQARTVTYQRVTEEQVVLDKEEAEAQQIPEDLGATKIMLEEIVAFLKGEPAPDSKKMAEELNEVANDPTKLADLILRAAEIRQAADVSGGESLMDIVVGCMRRACRNMMEDPTARTQQGKKQLTKTLMVLEKEVMDRLRGKLGDEAGDMEPITEAIDEMSTELAIDALAADYMKKFKGIETTQSRILRFLKSTMKADNPEAVEALKEKLTESGLTMDEWHELVVKSRATGRGGKGGKGGAGEGQGGPDGVGMLAVLLAQLDKMLETASSEGAAPTPEALIDVVSKVSRQVESSVEHAEEKIQELEQQFTAPPDETEPEAQARQITSRKTLMALLAEIVQELCQPLSVVNATVDMIRNRYLGQISTQQEEMLSLAAESGQRLKHLTDRLLQISGLPEGTKPDAALLKDIYTES